MGSVRIFAWITCLSIFFVFGASHASAEKRIAVLEIEGARKPELRKTVVRLLEPNITMSAQAYRNAAKRLRAKKLIPKNIRRVSRYLEADGIVDGTLESVGGRYRLVLRVRSGSTGTIVKKVTLKLTKPSLSSSMQKQLRVKLREGVRALSSKKRKMASDNIDEENVEDERDEISVDDERDKSESTSAARRRKRLSGQRSDEKNESFDDDEGVEDSDSDFEEDEREFVDVDSVDEDEETEEPKRNRRTKGVVVDRPRSFFVFAGVGTLKRNLDFTVEPAIEEPAAYEGSFVPTAYMAGEIFPMAFSGQSGFLAGIGLTGSYERALTISTSVPGGATPLDTVMDRFRVGGVIRHSFGNRASSPSIAITAGYNVHKFAIDKAASAVLVDIPNVEYKYIDPGLLLRFPAGKLAFFADVRGILILDAGEIQKDTAYGPATITGVDGDVGFEYSITKNILLRAGGRVSFFGFDFDSTGAHAALEDIDGDMMADVPGASDRYLGGYAAIGYQY